VSKSFRPMARDDLDTILRIEHLSFHQPWPRDAFEREFSNPVSRALVLEENGVLIGFVVTWLVADELHILDLAVEPDRRLAGLGRALVEETIRRGREEDAAYAILEVRPSNRTAMALYKGLGFKKIGRRVGYYQDNGEDALVMSLTLSEEAG
jgi:[ribosomal protein S18]-alanine N-acetyltransferase